MRFDIRLAETMIKTAYSSLASAFKQHNWHVVWGFTSRQSSTVFARYFVTQLREQTGVKHESFSHID
ncbi:hypothetical protein [Methylophilus methylotrophus]|uniref:hypothetical protein n=1 Tax=Methylophilus methylotrophus TaxID=17 RepID=UPI00036320A4|nr:hypothetical protein [Methylophilus methylotrophus]